MIDLSLPWPPSVNTYWSSNGSGRVWLSDKAKAYRKAVADSLILYLAELPTECRPKLPMNGRLAYFAVLYAPDKRRRDLDNFESKAIWDALKYAGAIEDDSQFSAKSTRFAMDGDNNLVHKGGLVKIKVVKS